MTGADLSTSILLWLMTDNFFDKFFLFYLLWGVPFQLQDGSINKQQAESNLTLSHPEALP